MHIHAFNLIPMNIQIFIDFNGPIIDDNFNPMSEPHYLPVSVDISELRYNSDRLVVNYGMVMVL